MPKLYIAHLDEWYCWGLPSDAKKVSDITSHHDQYAAIPREVYLRLKAAQKAFADVQDEVDTYRLKDPNDA